MSDVPPIPEGVDAAAWRAIGARVNHAGEWETPERDADGIIIGWVRRCEGGGRKASKIATKGSKRGLTFVPPLHPYAGSSAREPIYIVEGASCAAAGVTIGLDVVGRPSVSGGVQHLQKLLKERHGCLIMERDGKTVDAPGPGETEGRRVAEQLVDSCASVRAILPPKGVKDLREWVIAGATAADVHAAARQAAPLENPHGQPAANVRREAPGRVPLGQHDPDTGRLVLSPRQTLPTAEAYVREFHQIAQHRTLHGYGGLLLEWRGNHYTEIEDESVKHRLQPWLHNALRYEYNSRTHLVELVDFESNPNTVRHVLETIRSFVHLPASTVTPSWLSEAPDQPPALEILPCKTSNLHIPTSRVLNATPALFTINALDFDYDPDPDPPESWIKFLERLFGDDLESVELLQDWMGYCLTSDTRQQKILLLVGPRRSGKGTIARVLTRLVGAGNVAGPTTSGLARPFGLQPLIDKSLAIVSDARFNGENIAIVVERLLCISGEDALTIDRKFLSSVTMKLATRFMFLTNELPRLNDASTALAGRFLVLRLTHSFYDQEDTGLTQRLLGELPGILKWALEGWKRLQERGRFFQPASSSDAIQDLEDLSSPVHAFVREHCVTGPGHRVDLDRLYQVWTSWCQQEGRTVVTHKGTFGRDLVAAVPGVRRRRGTGLTPFYDGIGLRSLDL